MWIQHLPRCSGHSFFNETKNISKVMSSDQKAFTQRIFEVKNKNDFEWPNSFPRNKKMTRMSSKIFNKRDICINYKPISFYGNAIELWKSTFSDFSVPLIWLFLGSLDAHFSTSWWPCRAFRPDKEVFQKVQPTTEAFTLPKCLKTILLILGHFWSFFSIFFFFIQPMTIRRMYWNE